MQSEQLFAAAPGLETPWYVGATHFEGRAAWARTRMTHGFLKALHGLFQVARLKARGHPTSSLNHTKFKRPLMLYPPFSSLRGAPCGGRCARQQRDHALVQPLKLLKPVFIKAVQRRVG